MKPKVIVYTAIFGDCDSLKPAPVGPDFSVCFVDDPARFPNARGWTLTPWPVTNPRRDAWHLRCVPHLLFSGYSDVVWIDASFTLLNLRRLLEDAREAPIAALRHHERQTPYQEGQRLVRIGQSRKQDIEPQLAAYRKKGFHPNHLSISCVLVRNMSPYVEKFNETWAKEIDRWPGDNTQVSLDYSAWVHGITIRGLFGDRHHNPYAVHDHADHKMRRKPYAMTAAR